MAESISVTTVAADLDAVERLAPEEGPSTGTGFGRLARDSAIYALGAAVGKVVGIILLPVLTRSLTRSEFGRMDVLSTLQSAAASILLLGMDLAATRLFADLDTDERPRLFPSWLALTGMLGAGVVAVMAVAAAPISESFFDDDGYALAVALTGVAIAGSAVQLVALTTLRNHRRPVAFAVVSGGSLVVNGILVVALVPGHPTATAVMLAMAVSLVAGAVAGLVIARSHLRGRPSGNLTRRLVLLGIPLVPAVGATWVAELANRTILLKQASSTQVAYFSVATRFSSVAVLVVLGFQMAWQPAAFALGQSRESLQRIADDGRRILTAVGAAVGGVALLAPELVELLSGPKYLPAVRAVGFSLVFALGYATYHTATMPSALSKHMRDIGLAAIVAAAAGVALNAWWAGSGAWGTAAAVAAGQAIGAATALVLGRSRAPVPYPWGRLGLLLAATSAVTIAATWPDGGASGGLRAVLALGFVVVLLVEGTIRELVAEGFGRIARR